MLHMYSDVLQHTWIDILIVVISIVMIMSNSYVMNATTDQTSFAEMRKALMYATDKSDGES